MSSSFKSPIRKQSSPIKIRDFFTNPTHKIKQPSFLEVGFTQHTLNTFVKTFTNRYNPHNISYTAIKQFIRSFTNNSPKLIQTYDDFFVKHFQISKDGNINLQHFVQFFMKQQKPTLQHFDLKSIKHLFKDLGKLTADNIMFKCEQLGVAMNRKDADKMIKMINYDANMHNKEILQEEAFIQAMKISIKDD